MIFLFFAVKMSFPVVAQYGQLWQRFKLLESFLVVIVLDAIIEDENSFCSI